MLPEKMKQLLTGLAEAVSKNITDALAPVTRRLDALEAQVSDHGAQKVELLLDAASVQKSLDEFRAQLFQDIELAQARSVQQLDERIAAFNAVLVARDAQHAATSDQLKALLSERSALPAMDVLVHQVVNELRTSEADLVSRCIQAACAAIDEWKSALAAQLLALEQAFSATPSGADVARQAAALVEIPQAPDISGLLNAEQVQEMIRADRQKFAVAPLAPADVAREVLALLPAMPALEEIAASAAALVPSPKDGESFTLEQAKPLMLELAQGLIPTAEDVAQVLDATHLAKWALDFERRAQDLLQRAVDRMPVPKDGVDGMGFDDLVVEYDGERTFTVALVRGERRKAHSFKLPMMLYRKVYAEKVSYDRGDVVTWGGSSWVALKDAPQGKPGDASRDWQLIVKKGRDGSSA